MKKKVSIATKKATSDERKQIRCNEKNREKLEWQRERKKIYFYSSEL